MSTPGPSWFFGGPNPVDFFAGPTFYNATGGPTPRFVQYFASEPESVWRSGPAAMTWSSDDVSGG